MPRLTALNIAGIKLTGSSAAAPAAGDGQIHNAAALLPVPMPQPAAAGPANLVVPLPVPTDGPILSELLQRLESLTLGDPMALSFIADRLVVEELAAARPARLAHLDLSGCIDLTDWAVHELCCSTPSLTSLSLQSCVRLTNASLLELARLPRLRALNLRGCLQLNDAGLAAGLSGLSNLAELNLQGCTSITGSCLSEMAPCKSLAVLNVSHCAAFSSLEPLRVLPGLQRLAVSHCSKLSLGHVTALTALRQLTEVRASHLRNLIPLAATTAEQLAMLSSLDQLQALDLSYFSNPGGFPGGLLDAVAALTRLTRLCLAGCGGPSLAGGPHAGLAFLSDLRQLQELDLGAWQEVDPQELSCLAGATALRRLVVSRLGNRHANACFEGCDCNGSPASSLCPSLCSSPGLASPDSGSSPGAEQEPAAAAAAAAEARAQVAARGAAVLAALDAAAEDEDMRGSNGGCSTGCRSTGGCSTVRRSTGGGTDDTGCSVSCMSVDLDERDPQQVPRGPQYDTVTSQPPTARYVSMSTVPASSSSLPRPRAPPAPATPSLDSLARQMAAVGIMCCGGGSGSCCTRAACAAAAAVVAAAAVAVGRGGDADADACSGGHGDDGTQHVVQPPRDFEQLLAAMPAVAAPLPCLSDEAASSCRAMGLPPMPMTPRPGLDGSLGHLTGLTALAEIHLEACNHMTDVGVSRLARLPRLELLDLGGCNRVTGRTLGAFATHGSLHTLLLANCTSLTDAGLEAACSVASLRVVDVSGCSRLTDAGTLTLGSLRRLSRLSLRGNSKCSDRTVEVLAGLPALQWLSLSLCGALTDASLRLMAASRSLTWLDVSHCWRLSRGGVRELEAARPQLKVIFTGRH